MTKKKKAPQRRNPADTLPAKHPKKTGSRGVKAKPFQSAMTVVEERGVTEIQEEFLPEVAAADVDMPTEAAQDAPAEQERNTVEGSNAAFALDQQAPPAAEKKEPPKQLLKVEKPRTPAVQNNRMSMHFIGFRAHRLKDRTRAVTMKFSLELESEHEERLPKMVEKEWTHFQRSRANEIKCKNVGTYKVDMSIAPDQAGFEFTAEVPYAVLSRVVEKGKGQSRHVTRLEIHFLTTYAVDSDRFCRNCFDETVWAKMVESQDSLFDED